MSQRSGIGPVTDQEVDAILRRFLQSDLTIEEAEVLIERLRTAPDRVTEKLLALLRDSPAEDRNIVIVLLGTLGGSSAAQPVLAMIHDESVDDDYKLKLISLVTQLDPDVDIASLLDDLRDLHGALRRSQREYLHQLRSPVDLVLWLEMMEGQLPPKARASFCRASLELDDAAAVPVLICMCYDPDDDVALTAIDTVERFKDLRALSAFEELAERHPSRAVRIESRNAADRLRIRASLVPQAKLIPAAPLYACYLTTIDGAGGQMALVVRERADSTLEAVNVMFNDQEGIVQCFGIHTDMDELEDTLDALAEQYISPVRVSHSQCLVSLDLAVEATWKNDRVLPMSYIAWRNVIEGGRVEGEAELSPLVVLPERRDELLNHCHELLLQDEFAHWFFDPDEIGDLDDRYLDMLAKRAPQPGSVPEGSPGETARGGTHDDVDPPALRRLLRDGVREIVTDRTRSLIQGRLLRVAPLLRELYEEDEVWQWAVVAADALVDDSPLPVEEHPLLLGMIACSLENAIGETIAWVDARVVARHE